MPRLFAGLELPEEVREQLADLERPLPGAKWVDMDDLHITLRFAGDLEGLVAREFEQGLAEIDVDACAAPNGSYSLSSRLVNPESPPGCRSVRMRSRRPVMILCG